MSDLALYDGLLARAYDAFLREASFCDLPLWRRLAAERPGPVLDLGCGTGRVLLALLDDGIVAEGLDNSADMLALCREKAAAAGHAPVLHHAGMAEFDLGIRYGTILCAVASLTLLERPGEMERALAASRRHLRSGGVLAVSMDAPAPPPPAGRRLAREAPAGDGARYRCWLEPVASPWPDVARAEMTTELVGPDGRVVQADVRTIGFRRLAPPGFAALLRDAGFGGVQLLGPDGGELGETPAEYVAIASA